MIWICILDSYYRFEYDFFLNVHPDRQPREVMNQAMTSMQALTLAIWVLAFLTLTSIAQWFRVRDNMCIGGAPSSMLGMLLEKKNLIPLSLFHSIFIPILWLYCTNIDYIEFSILNFSKSVWLKSHLQHKRMNIDWRSWS